MCLPTLGSISQDWAAFTRWLPESCPNGVSSVGVIDWSIAADCHSNVILLLSLLLPLKLFPSRLFSPYAQLSVCAQSAEWLICFFVVDVLFSIFSTHLGHFHFASRRRSIMRRLWTWPHFANRFSLFSFLLYLPDSRLAQLQELETRCSVLMCLRPFIYAFSPHCSPLIEQHSLISRCGW